MAIKDLKIGDFVSFDVSKNISGFGTVESIQDTEGSVAIKLPSGQIIGKSISVVKSVSKEDYLKGIRDLIASLNSVVGEEKENKMTEVEIQALQTEILELKASIAKLNEEKVGLANQVEALNTEKSTIEAAKKKAEEEIEKWKKDSESKARVAELRKLSIFSDSKEEDLVAKFGGMERSAFDIVLDTAKAGQTALTKLTEETQTSLTKLTQETQTSLTKLTEASTKEEKVETNVSEAKVENDPTLETVAKSTVKTEALSTALGEILSKSKNKNRKIK